MAAVLDAGFHERDNFLLEQVERIWRRFFRKRGKKFLSLLGRVVSRRDRCLFRYSIPSYRNREPFELRVHVSRKLRSNIASSVPSLIYTTARRHDGRDSMSFLRREKSEILLSDLKAWGDSRGN